MCKHETKARKKENASPFAFAGIFSDRPVGKIAIQPRRQNRNLYSWLCNTGDESFFPPEQAPGWKDNRLTGGGEGVASRHSHTQYLNNFNWNISQHFKVSCQIWTLSLNDTRQIPAGFVDFVAILPSTLDPLLGACCSNPNTSLLLWHLPLVCQTSPGHLAPTTSFFNPTPPLWTTARHSHRSAFHKCQPQIGPSYPREQ